MVITAWRRSALFRTAADLFAHSRGDAGRRDLGGSGSVTFVGGRTALNLISPPPARNCSSRRYRGARDGPDRDPSDGQGGSISVTLKLDKGQFTSPRKRRGQCPQAPGARDGLDPGEVIEIGELSPWKLDLKLAGATCESPVSDHQQ